MSEWSKEVVMRDKENSVPLSAAEFIKVIDELTLPGAYPKVREIATVLRTAKDGRLTQNAVYKKLGLITGERKKP